MGQRSFKKCKPWYVKINTTHNTCCCRYHIEYSYYYDTYIHILCGLHKNIVQECSATFPVKSSRDYIHSIWCIRTEGCTLSKALHRWDIPRVWWNGIFVQMHTCDRWAWTWETLSELVVIQICHVWYWWREWKRKNTVGHLSG